MRKTTSQRVSLRQKKMNKRLKLPNQKKKER